ncbi:MAG: peptidylprolyl isomerase [Planctomycetota bacterium]
MNDTRRPQLTLDQPPKALQPSRRSRMVPALLVLVLVLQAVVAWRLWSGGEGAGATSFVLEPKATRELALALEEKGLNSEAARAWEAYLEQAPSDPDRSSIAYRAGRLRMDERDFAGAARDFVQAELLAKRDQVTLEGNVGLKIVECLRQLGRYGDVGRELARRVRVGEAEDPGRPLATYEGEKITAATLDRMVEHRIDQMLGPGVRADDPRREALLEQLSSPEARRRLLEDLLREELLSRKAREEGIDKEDGFLELVSATERGLLAGWLMNRELAKLEPSELELRNHFEAHRADFREPDRAAVVVLELREGETAESFLATIPSSDAFRAAAAARSSEGLPSSVVRGASDPVLGPTGAIFALAPGEWLERPLEYQGQRFLVMSDGVTEGAIPDFEAVRSRVAREYMEQKREEFGKQLMSELMQRYDVKIFEPEESGAKPPAGGGS